MEADVVGAMAAAGAVVAAGSGEGQEIFAMVGVSAFGAGGGSWAIEEEEEEAAAPQPGAVGIGSEAPEQAHRPRQPAKSGSQVARETAQGSERKKDRQEERRAGEELGCASTSAKQEEAKSEGRGTEGSGSEGDQEQLAAWLAKDFEEHEACMVEEGLRMAPQPGAVAPRATGEEANANPQPGAGVGSAGAAAAASMSEWFYIGDDEGGLIVEGGVAGVAFVEAARAAGGRGGAGAARASHRGVVWQGSSWREFAALPGNPGRRGAGCRRTRRCRRRTGQRPRSGSAGQQLARVRRAAGPSWATRSGQQDDEEVQVQRGREAEEGKEEEPAAAPSRALGEAMVGTSTSTSAASTSAAALGSQALGVAKPRRRTTRKARKRSRRQPPSRALGEAMVRISTSTSTQRLEEAG